MLLQWHQILLASSQINSSSGHLPHSKTVHPSEENTLDQGLLMCKHYTFF